MADIARFVRFCAALIACSFFACSAAQAETRVYSLAHGAMLGASSTRAQLRQLVESRRDRVLAAARLLGMNHAQRLALLQRLEAGDVEPTWMPRRLPSMSWYHAGKVQLLYDVYLVHPAKGWIVNVSSATDGNAFVFIPQQCGNFSLLPMSGALAAVVQAAPLGPWAPAWNLAPPEYSALAFQPELPSIAQPARKRFAFPWWLLALVLPTLHGGGSSPNTPIVPPPNGGPTPPPDTYQCWEEPIPMCDSATQARHRRAGFAIRLRIP